MTRITAGAALGNALLIVDAVYEGGRLRTASQGVSLANDPLSVLLGVRNQGGIRAKGPANETSLRRARMTGRDADWPDSFDRTTGHLVYYGDNRRVEQPRVLDEVSIWSQDSDEAPGAALHLPPTYRRRWQYRVADARRACALSRPEEA